MSKNHHVPRPLTSRPLTRRHAMITGAALLPAITIGISYARKTTGSTMTDQSTGQDWANLTKDQWKERLTDAQFRVLRKEATERPGSSPLDNEKRDGTFVCAGCALPIFAASTKFDSGTGWPSFYDYLPGALEFKTDYKLVYPRKEYHCSRCGGHQGHIFNDGPKPTGLRYCNNGVALNFVVKDA